MSSARLPAIPAGRLTAAQKAAAEAFAQERGQPPFGPFVPLLRSPELMQRAAALGHYLRYRSALPHKLNELVILVTARHWTQAYEWHVHAAAAGEAGLAPGIVAAVAEGRRPDGLSEEEAIVYDFSTELHQKRSVSDATYAKALARFGEQGLVDMVGVNGYYSLLAMVLNVARTPLPDGAEPGLRPFPD